MGDLVVNKIIKYLEQPKVFYALEYYSSGPIYLRNLRDVSTMEERMGLAAIIKQIYVLYYCSSYDAYFGREKAAILRRFKDQIMIQFQDIFDEQIWQKYQKRKKEEQGWVNGYVHNMALPVSYARKFTVSERNYLVRKFINFCLLLEENGFPLHNSFPHYTKYIYKIKEINFEEFQSLDFGVQRSNRRPFFRLVVNVDHRDRNRGLIFDFCNRGNCRLVGIG